MNPQFPSLFCNGCRRPVLPRELRMVLGHDRALYLCPACRSAGNGDPVAREGRWKARQCDCVFRHAEDCALFQARLPFCPCRCHSI